MESKVAKNSSKNLHGRHFGPSQKIFAKKTLFFIDFGRLRGPIGLPLDTISTSFRDLWREFGQNVSPKSPWPKRVETNRDNSNNKVSRRYHTPKTRQDLDKNPPRTRQNEKRQEKKVGRRYSPQRGLSIELSLTSRHSIDMCF